MINLLPDNQKKLIYKEYRIRLHVVVLAFLLSLVGISVLLLLPSYFLTLYRAQLASNKEVVLHTSTAAQDRTDMENQLKDQKTLLKVLAVTSSSTNPLLP